MSIVCRSISLARMNDGMSEDVCQREHSTGPPCAMSTFIGDQNSICVQNFYVKLSSLLIVGQRRLELTKFWWIWPRFKIFQRCRTLNRQMSFVSQLAQKPHSRAFHVVTLFLFGRFDKPNWNLPCWSVQHITSSVRQLFLYSFIEL